MKTANKTAKSTKKETSSPKKVTKKATVKTTAKKATEKKVAKKAPAKPKAKKAAAPVEQIIAPEINKTENKTSVEKEPEVTFQEGNIRLASTQAAKDFRAMKISQASKPVALLEVARQNIKDKLSIFNLKEGVKKELNEQLAEIESKIREYIQRAQTFRTMSIEDLAIIEYVKIPSFVHYAGQICEDLATRAAVALGFSPSRAHLIGGVKFIS